MKKGSWNLAFIFLLITVVTVVPAIALDVPARTITIDGLPGDWAGIPPLLTDPSGDSPCGVGTDIISLYLAQDASFLYWRIDTSDGLFTWDGQDTTKGPGVTFYSLSGGSVLAGITASMPGNPSIASISVQYPGPEWTHLATCPRYAKTDQVAEGKIPLILFNGYLFNSVYAWYSSGIGTALCDEAQIAEDLAILPGLGLATPLQLSPPDGFATESTSVLLEWTGGNGVDEELEVIKNGGLYLRERACGNKLLENLRCGTYYWKVRSCIRPDCFDWSLWRSFRIDCPPTPTPTPTPPPGPQFACDPPSNLECNDPGPDKCHMSWSAPGCSSCNKYWVEVPGGSSAITTDTFLDLWWDCPNSYKVRCLDAFDNPTSDWSDEKFCGVVQ